MNCIRCKYIINEKVYNFSNTRFGFSLCKNCQEWYLENNESLNNKDKKFFLETILLLPSITYYIPEYQQLLDYFGKEHILIKSKELESYTYILEDFNGTKHRIETNFLIENFTNLKFGNKTYRISQIGEEEIYCREIPVREHNLTNLHKGDEKTLIYEEEIINFFEKRNIKLLPNSLNEKYFTDLILSELSKYFIIEKEVTGIHFSGKKIRLDAILKPKDNSEWRNKNLVIGLEIKNPILSETNNRRDTDILAQCLDYSFSKFKDYDDIIILVCPLLPSLKRNDKLIRFLSRYNVGHLDFNERGISMGLGGQSFWNEWYTPTFLKKSLFKNKYGNRENKN